MSSRQRGLGFLASCQRSVFGPGTQIEADLNKFQQDLGGDFGFASVKVEGKASQPSSGTPVHLHGNGLSAVESLNLKSWQSLASAAVKILSSDQIASLLAFEAHNKVALAESRSRVAAAAAAAGGRPAIARATCAARTTTTTNT
ncbi:hypothetical protein AAMO2058_001492400 [Amorphochlora amoebiformis]